jgi:hypothetical protein
MGEPALVLAEEAAAEAAAEQTTQLILIEGGGEAAAGSAEAVAVESGAAEAVATGAGAASLAILAFFLVLLWPSNIAPEPEIPRPPTPPKKPVEECAGAEESAAEKEERELVLEEKCERLARELNELKREAPKNHPMDTGNPKKESRIPCSYLKNKLRHTKKLLDKRWEIQNTCFGGKPDQGHQEQIEQIESSIKNYERLEKINCAKGHPMAGL